MERLIDCPTCGGEGREWRSRYSGNDPDVWDAGPCKDCDGTGQIEADEEPITIGDLIDMGED